MATSDQPDAAGEQNGETRSMRGFALSGGRWRAIESITVQGLQAVSTVVLARLLLPEDFGIVAVVTLVLALFGVVTDIGFGASVIRRPEIDRAYLSSVFWAASAIGLVSAAVSVALSPVFAALGGNTDATPYLVVASAVLLFGMVKSIPHAVVLRAFRFMATAMTSVGGFVLYLVTAVTLAATTDVGAWSIVIGRVASSGFQMVVIWVLSRFLPMLHIRWSEIREDLGFNMSFLGMRGSQYLAKNIDYWFVGSALGSASLGVYYIAYVLPNLLRRRMTSTVAGPVFVTVAAFADDRQRVKKAYLEAIRAVALGAGPVLVGMALVSDGLIRIAFGTKWLEAIEPMTILTIAAAINVIGPVGSGILTAIGKPHRNIIVNMSSTAMIAFGLWLMISGGDLVTVSAVVLAATLLSRVVQFALIRGPLDVRLSEFVLALLPPTVALVAMSIVVLGVRLLLGDATTQIVGMVAIAAGGAATYLGTLFLFFRPVFAQLRRDLSVMFMGR